LIIKDVNVSNSRIGPFLHLSKGGIVLMFSIMRIGRGDEKDPSNLYTGVSLKVMPQNI
jgi:hypothetical protein